MLGSYEKMTYVWEIGSVVKVDLSGANTARPTFTAPTQLTEDVVLTFDLVVYDSEGLRAKIYNRMDVIVKAGETNPLVVNAGPDQTVAEGAAVTLGGSASSDHENGMLTYAWRQIGGPEVDLSGEASASPRFTAPVQFLEDAVLTFDLTVTDAGGLQATDSVRITVTAGVDDPPVVNAGPDQTVAEGTTVTLDGSGSFDPEGGGVVLYLVQLSHEYCRLERKDYRQTDLHGSDTANRGCRPDIRPTGR